MSPIIGYLKLKQFAQIDKFVALKIAITDQCSKRILCMLLIEKIRSKKATRVIRLAKLSIKQVQRKIYFTKMNIKKRVTREGRILKLIIHQIYRRTRLEIKCSTRKMHRTINIKAKHIALPLSMIRNIFDKEHIYITSLVLIFIAFMPKFIDFPTVKFSSTLHSKSELHTIIEKFLLLPNQFKQEILHDMKQKISNKMGQLSPFNLNLAVVAQNGSTPTSTTPIYVMVHSTEIATLSSETAATIKYILKEDDVFKKGDILIEFDCRVQKAELRRAQAQEKMTTSAHKSAMKLSSYGSISESELIKAEAEADMATADVEKLTAQVDKCIVKAPYNGSVSDALAHVDESLKPGDPLLKIVNTENLDLEMQIPSNWLKWLHVGTPFEFRIHELNKTVAAKVYKINPEINSVSQTIKIRGELTLPDPALLPGMSGIAIFPENTVDNNTNKGDNLG